MKEKRIEEEKNKILRVAPPLGELIRGTFREVWLECIREKCKCHKSKKYRHGPFYRIGYGKGKKIHTVYVSKEKKAQAKRYTDNYNKLWKTDRKTCKCSGQIIIAPVGIKIIPKGKFSLNFWVDVLVNKYKNHFPIERQISEMKEYGLDISAGSIFGGLQKIYFVYLFVYLKPLYE